MLTEALELAQQGHYLLPITPGSKYPPLPDPYGDHGWETATNDTQAILDWWNTYPTANIAWSPGASGNIVIDIDGPTGKQTLTNQGLTFDPQKPPTRAIKTTRPDGHGYHLIYQLPQHLYDIGKGEIGPRLEYIVNKQYALLPPSRTPTGTYQWLSHQPPAMLPETLWEPLATIWEPPPLNTDPKDPDCKYCPTAAQQKIQDLRNTTPGNRNNTLFAKTREILKLPDIDHQTILNQLKQTAHQTGQTPKETQKTIDQAIKNHTKEWGAPGNGPGCPADYKKTVHIPPPKPLTGGAGTGAAAPQQWLTRIIDHIDEEYQDWLIQDWIPLKATTLCYGDSDKGKSTLLTRWAADLSNTKQLHTIYCSGDRETPESIIKPRWRAAQGHPHGLSVLEDRQRDKHGNPIKPTHIHNLHNLHDLAENTLQQLKHINSPIQKIGMIILDPVENFLPPEINTHNGAQVKQALEPLSLIAQQHDLAIIMVQHTNKNEGATAKNRANGSGGFMSYARSAFVVGINPENHKQRAIKIVKGNIIGNKPCHIYQFETKTWTINHQGTEQIITAPTLTYSHEAPHITGQQILDTDPENPNKTDNTLETIQSLIDKTTAIWADTLKNIITQQTSRNKYYQALQKAKALPEQMGGIYEGRHPTGTGPYYYTLKSTPPETAIQHLETGSPPPNPPLYQGKQRQST